MDRLSAASIAIAVSSRMEARRRMLVCRSARRSASAASDVDS